METTDFLLHTIPKQALFGLKTIWQEKVKVLVSDPTRTILDFLIDPKLAGGIRTAVDIFNEYLKSQHKNLPLLVDYANRVGVCPVFKRMGFLLQQYAPDELDIINAYKKTNHY